MCIAERRKNNMINKVVLVGRLTKDIELKTTPNGKYVTDFTLAVDKFGDGANFLSCQCWGKSAEFLSKYAKKGNVVAVDGSVESTSWEKNGTTFYKTFVLANIVKTYRWCKTRSKRNCRK